MSASSNPLYSQDRTELNEALKLGPSEAFAVTTMGRLRMRYPLGTPHRDIHMDVTAWLRTHNLDEEGLYSLSRQAWENGYRPGRLEANSPQPQGAGVGSGADVVG